MKQKDFQDLCKRYKTKIFYTASYYPRADPTERVNLMVKTFIRSYVKNDCRMWGKNMASIGCALRTCRHKNVKHTPFYLNFGREHNLYGQDYAEKIPIYDLDPHDRVKHKE